MDKNIDIFDDIFWDEERDGPRSKNKKKGPYSEMDYFFDTCSVDELVQYMIDTSGGASGM